MQTKTRLVVLTLLAAMCLLAPASLLAPEAAYGQGAPRVAPGSSQGDQWGDKEPPEGFVKSKEPKKSESSYNWVQMGYASLVMLVMGGFVVFLIRRNSGGRAGGHPSDADPSA